jgi:hypothetical protein
MEAARLTLRWLSTPNQASSENAQAKLAEARASLSELEWLFPSVVPEVVVTEVGKAKVRAVR